MKQCETCSFAAWKLTTNGRLHPSKDGRCHRLDVYPLDVRLPAAFYWMGNAPQPSGGYIKRGEPDVTKCQFKAGMK